LAAWLAQVITSYGGHGKPRRRASPSGPGGSRSHECEREVLVRRIDEVRFILDDTTLTAA
jgi:hypothetical protein